MSDTRDDVIAAIRERLLTVPNLWPVQWHNKPYTPVAQTPFISESLIFGTTRQGALKAGTNLYYRTTTEGYQLTFNIPAGVDIRTATTLANTIETTIFDTPIVAPNDVTIWFTSSSKADRGIDSGWQKLVLVLRYTYIYNA